ncbi:hypothetical protein BBJ28_00006669 [Nothophytophthora sp. Chile5]|nr:hypothetical protein BBJ28_00006669 [Nothophytophthora sp. Chile5]
MAKSAATHQLNAHAFGSAPSASASSSPASSSSASRRVSSKGKLPASPSSSPGHHPKYKSDVGQLVYYFLREYPPAPTASTPAIQQHTSAPGGSVLTPREPQPEPSASHHSHYHSRRQHQHQLQLRQRHRAMPRQKDTKRIDPTRVRAEGESHTVFKASGSPIISPRSIRHCLEEPEFDLNGKPRRKSSDGGVTLPARPRVSREDALVAAAAKAAQAKEEQAALEAEQSMSGYTGVQLVVHRLLSAHTHTLAQLGIERADFPNTRLSLKQVETLLGPVVAMCNVMQPVHFGIHVPTPEIARTMNDVHYWKLWESDTIDIGIFFMPPNSVIPLHNHPGMSVVTRVLYGSVNVTSYDVASEEDARQVEAEGEAVPGSSSDANRDCHHFKIVEEKLLRNERMVKMLESIKPDNHNEPVTPPNGTAPSSPTSS